MCYASKMLYKASPLIQTINLPILHIVLALAITWIFIHKITTSNFHSIVNLRLHTLRNARYWSCGLTTLDTITLHFLCTFNSQSCASIFSGYRQCGIFDIWRCVREHWRSYIWLIDESEIKNTQGIAFMKLAKNKWVGVSEHTLLAFSRNTRNTREANSSDLATWASSGMQKHKSKLFVLPYTALVNTLQQLEEINIRYFTGCVNLNWSWQCSMLWKAERVIQR